MRGLDPLVWFNPEPWIVRQWKKATEPAFPVNETDFFKLILFFLVLILPTK